MGVRDCLLAIARERRGAGQGLEQEAGQGVPVAGAARQIPAELLGRRVGQVPARTALVGG